MGTWRGEADPFVRDRSSGTCRTGIADLGKRLIHESRTPRCPFKAREVLAEVGQLMMSNLTELSGVENRWAEVTTEQGDAAA